MISGFDDIAGSIALRANGQFADVACDGNEDTYLRILIAAIQNGGNGHTGTKLNTRNWDDIINDIAVLLGWGKRANGFLAEAAQSIMRSELGKPIRISKPGAIYGESPDALTFDDINEFRNIPIDST